MKTIGLDGSRAFLAYKTGIEEYSYQVIKHLRKTIPKEVRVRLYVRKKLHWQEKRFIFVYPEIDFSLPDNWELCGIWAPRFWTQIGLSLEMFFQPVETLFVPAHTLPLMGGKRNVVTVHGLEYEICQEAYSLWERLYMRHSIQFSCRKADTVIAVSKNTREDLLKLYQVAEEKIRVVYEGYIPQDEKQESVSSHRQSLTTDSVLFIGRLEERKNILRLIEAFEILKERFQRGESLVLIGKKGYGYEKIAARIEASKYKENIEVLGYVTDREKKSYLENASVFTFATLYEGFGLPVLEAQAAGVAVVTSNTSSLPEVGGEGAVYVDPLSSESIAEGLSQVLQMSEEEKATLILRGKENLTRFSWEKCAQEIAEVLV